MRWETTLGGAGFVVTEGAWLWGAGASRSLAMSYTSPVSHYNLDGTGGDVRQHSLPALPDEMNRVPLV